MKSRRDGSATNVLADAGSSLRRLLNRLPIAVSHSDRDGRILTVNDRFVEIFGYTADDIRTIEEWWPRAYPDPVYRQNAMDAWAAAMARSVADGTDIPALTYEITRKDGGVRLVEVSGVVLEDGLIVTFVDVTERKHAEDVQRQLMRELRAISECNQALMRAEDEQALLEQVCRIICEEAGYRMAWVGYAEHDDARTVRPRAWAGEEAGYLSLTSLTWADTPAGQRPFGIAIRSGETSYAQDFSSETWSATWTAHALQRGYRSGIALPLKTDKSDTFGVLCIYSTQTNAFTPDEINLLEELAGDLAFGITSLRLRAQQEEAKKQLAASEQLFRTLVENSPEPIARYDRQLRRIYVNQAIRKLFAAPVEQVLGLTPASGSPLVDPDSYMAAIRRVIETAAEQRLDGAYRSPDGSTGWSSWRFVPEFGADGKVATVLTISHDITERRQAEEERLAHLRFLESMDRINRTIQSAVGLDQMMSDVLDVVLDVFGCDRAFLLHPCDPDASEWTVPMERTRPEYPGVLALNQPIPMDQDVANTLRALLDHPGPLLFGPGEDQSLPRSAAERFAIKSIISTALRPKIGKPWQFGLHQCARERRWTPEEERLFEEIGNRVADSLGSLLMTRNLRASEERFRLVFENSPVPIQEEDYSAVKARIEALRPAFGDDVDGYLAAHPELFEECTALVRVVDVNRAAVQLHEAGSKEALLAGLAQTFLPETADVFRRALGIIARGETELTAETAIRTLPGRRQQVSVYFTVCPGYEETWGKVLVSLIDITERKRAEAGLLASEQLFRTLVENSPDFIARYDLQLRRRYVNPALQRIFKTPPAETLGQLPTSNSPLVDPARYMANLKQAIDEKQDCSGELAYRDPEGKLHWGTMRAVPELDAGGNVISVLAITRDISVIKEHEADLDRIAHYDTLTSVPNRRLLSDRMDQAIARSRRHGSNFAVCYLDLDGFKPVNDQFGHEGGDLLLVEIARRLQAMSRADDTVARLGGDEFVLLWNDIGAEARCTHALERVLAEVSAPVVIDGISVSVSASIGVTLFPDDNVDADSLLRHADHAMYSAKQLGKNRYQMFDARLEQQITTRIEFLAKVGRGMDRGQFELFYQPKVDCVTGKVIGVEALVRWNEPILGLLSPKEFLPLIEDDNLAFRMGRWVMEEAVRQARRWHDAGIHLCISINVFPRHLQYPTFIEDLRNAVSVHWPQMPRDRLMMEIVETSDLEELDPIEAVIKECLEMGIPSSLDDFGTGYSSLIYLRRLSVEELKIDQSFVRDMLDDPEDRAIVVGVIGLGKAFGLRVVAEGVESQRHARHLIDLGCTVVQGYGLGHPMPVAELQKWLTEFESQGGRIWR